MPMANNKMYCIVKNIDVIIKAVLNCTFTYNFK